MTLTSIIGDASGIVAAVGTVYNSLSTDFGAVLLIPVTLVIARAIIGIMKGILMFKRGRGRR